MAPMFFLLVFAALGSNLSEIKDVYQKNGQMRSCAISVVEHGRDVEREDAAYVGRVPNIHE